MSEAKCTMVFNCDLRKFNGNPHKAATPFGFPQIVQIGDGISNVDIVANAHLIAARAAEAEREACIALRDDIADLIGARPLSSIHSALCEYANAIRSRKP